MDGDQANRIICNMEDPKEMANALLKVALRSRECTDNVTICVVNLN